MGIVAERRYFELRPLDALREQAELHQRRNGPSRRWLAGWGIYSASRRLGHRAYLFSVW